jgi:hypothetical protein
MEKSISRKLGEVAVEKSASENWEGRRGRSGLLKEEGRHAESAIPARGGRSKCA